MNSAETSIFFSGDIFIVIAYSRLVERLPISLDVRMLRAQIGHILTSCNIFYIYLYVASFSTIALSVDGYISGCSEWEKVLRRSYGVVSYCIWKSTVK